MFNSKTILSFIGARAGSKGFKNKNIADLGGKPLIHWTVEASIASHYVDRTIVSTDGKHIAQAAKKAGADVPFLRPAELAEDTSLLDEAMQHCVQWLSKNENSSYDYILLLQPTSPLRTAAHIDQAIEHYFKNKKTDQDLLMSITRAPKKVGWLMEEKESGYIGFCFNSLKRSSRRQALPDYYLPNGVIYFAPTEVMEHLSKNTSHILPFLMDDAVSIDIDSKEDLREAAGILNNRRRMGINV